MKFSWKKLLFIISLVLLTCIIGLFIFVRFMSGTQLGSTVEVDTSVPLPSPPEDTFEYSEDSPTLGSAPTNIEDTISIDHLPPVQTSPSDNNNGGPTTTDSLFSIVRVLYGTNRELYKNGEDIAKIYTSIPTEHINYGIVHVSIPAKHKKGNLETPGTIDKWLKRDKDPEKFIIVANHSTLDSTGFYNTLKQYLSVVKDEVLVFIHGYNTDFNAAVRRSAQLFYDLEYDGVPILYSWPSKGTLTGYLYDESQIDFSKRCFKKFILDIIKNNPSKRINIIAHSMGNRLLTSAIESIHEVDTTHRINNIIMAAPDVNTQHFHSEEVYTRMKTFCKKLTIYCSNNDMALKSSVFFHSKINRLGLAGSQLYVRNPFETIDVSDIKCGDILQHTCVANSKHVIDDIKAVLNGTASSKRVKHLYKGNRTYNLDSGMYYYSLNNTP